MNTDKHWRAWGRQDPYFAVLSDSRFRRGGNRQEFFASGIETVNALVATAKRYFGLNQSSALEFGSGVGRLTRRLTEPLMQMNAYHLADVIESASTKDIHDFAMAPHLEKRFSSVILFARKV